ncbi:MAG: hypothetical protein K0S46_2186 [Moraxellaceae bacterium]|jgi:hypothetical protein|nr:hypothetical protein [Moraxellaceae bacterium]
MSEALPVSAASLVVWSRDARPPAQPARAPTLRHKPLGGLAAFDWQWRHRFALRREERFLAAALAAADSEEGALSSAAPGDITVQDFRMAFADSCRAAGLDATPSLQRQVLALLRGCYVAMPESARLQAVSVAAAVAARCGLAVHLACEEKERVAPLLAAVNAALGDDLPPAVALAEAGADADLVSGAGAGVVCGTASSFAHAWLRWGGESGALDRAAGWLSGAAARRYSFAALLLTPDGDRVLLDLIRHPLQLTRDQAEDSAALMLELAAMTADWQEGVEFADGSATAQGSRLLDEVAARKGGLWSVPRLRSAYFGALLAARRLVPDRDFTLAEGRLNWLVDTTGIATDPAQLAHVELALRSLHGQAPGLRIRRRAWFMDFFCAYARIGAAGANPGAEWRDLWWLHALPVLDNRPHRLQPEWTTASPVADGVRLFIGNARLRGLPGLPTDLPSLETRDGARLLAEAVVAGDAVRVLGPVAATRQLPAEVSSIMLAADARVVPAPFATLAGWLLQRGRPGHMLARLLGRWVLWRAQVQRYDIRRALVLRHQQERRTYAFTGDGRED